MTAVDSSVAIASFSRWHEHHDAAHALVAGGASIPAHAALETYSVLTRLPAPIQIVGTVAAKLLDGAFSSRIVTLPVERQQGLVASLAALEIEGGAVYDALIGLTAHEADEVLITLDKRALATYERCGVGARLLAG